MLPGEKMRLKNRRNFWAATVRLGMFLGPLGKKSCIFVGLGPKRSYVAKIIKIGLGGGTGPCSKARPISHGWPLKLVN